LVVNVYYEQLAFPLSAPIKKDLFHVTHLEGIDMLSGLEDIVWEWDLKCRLGLGGILGWLRKETTKTFSTGRVRPGLHFLPDSDGN